MSREAMKLALDYIVATNKSSEFWLVPESNLNKTVIALREELAKPDFWEGYVPEPVKPAQCKYPKCIYPCPDLPDCRDAEQPAQRPIKTFHGGKPWLVQKSAQQEPFGYFKAEPFGWTDCAETDEGAVALYERPAQQEPDNSDDLTIAYMAGVHRGKELAQRTWVGLTNKDVYECEPKTDLYDSVEFALAIEAKLKEKNT